MKALIFAAGLGTRLRPITDTMPKAMVPVGGRPLLYHTVMRLKAAGIREIVVNVHHFADMIIGYIAENDGFGLDIKVSDEREMLRETGGGIQQAQPLLGSDEPFLIHNVDIVSNLDINRFASEARPEALATVLVSDRKTQRYLLFNDEMRLVGWTNVATGEVKTPFPDLDISKCRKLAFAGIHLVSGRIFDAFKDLGFSGKFSIIDFYVKACAEYPIYGAAPENLELIDVGKLETLAEAEKALESWI